MSAAPFEWPNASSAKARFLVPSTPAADGGGEEDASASEQPAHCRITFHAPSGVIRVVSDPSDDDDDDDNAGDDCRVPTEILDEFDPADVIGAELEIQFTGDALAESLAERLKLNDDENDDNDNDGNRSPASARENEDGGEGTRSTAGEEEEERHDAVRFQDTDDCAGILPPRPTEEELTGVSRSLNDQATAFLNVYCYPRRRKGDGFLSWCNPFASPTTSSQATTAKNDALEFPPGAAEPAREEVDPTELGRRFAHHRRYEVAPCFDFADARAIVRAIRRTANLGQFVDAHGDSHDDAASSSSRPRRYLVLANPHGGTGQARGVYDGTVRPMLEQAGVEHDLVLTEYAGHARDIVASKPSPSKDGATTNVEATDGTTASETEPSAAAVEDISNYDGVVILGGDGTLFEILQGVRGRPDAAEMLNSVKFGVIGCGTSNGLAKSVLHQRMEKYSTLESTFLICKGQSSPIDLSMYEVGERAYTGFLTFSWAFIADVDLDSECIRFAGPVRTDLWAAYRILAKRSYRARFSYLPASKVGDKTKPIDMPALTDAVPEEWETVEGDFILFWASQVSHAAFNTFQSPLSQLQDGLFHVMVVRKPISRVEMIKMFLNIETGGHIEHDKCEQFDCVAFRLCPLEDGSHNDLDGEKIESGPIQAQVLPASMLFFSGAAASSS